MIGTHAGLASNRPPTFGITANGNDQNSGLIHDILQPYYRNLRRVSTPAGAV
jgi:hypothetical protein